MASPIVQKAEEFVTRLLREELTPDLKYHNVAHTLANRNTALDIGRRYLIAEEELELLELASLFHDTGFTKIYNGHEKESQKIAESFLKENNYPEDKIQKVLELIEITTVGIEPTTLPGKILKDADFNTGDGSFKEKSEALRHEWKVMCGREFTETAWLDNNLKFWASHQFYTGEAFAMFGEEKRKTVKQYKKQLKELLGEAASKPDKLEMKISGNKSALVMFRTILRNQVDLTNIADNKANIMLSINSLLITIGIPMMAGNLDRFPNLIFPAAILLTTCILSIVFATLATRPVKMPGYTNIDEIKEKSTNLFFFGNFYKMNVDEYRKGIAEVLKNEAILDNSIITDLFFHGKILGLKFMRLRTCYGIFMIGMICTVLAFAVSLLLAR